MVTEHKDIEDEGQTVLITERIIKIHTSAASMDGEKVVEAGKEVSIVDTVTLDGLEVGAKYQLKGWQMDKDKNAELLIDGKPVENELTFTATDTKMELEIKFTFDASFLGGKQLVTFEELYDVTNPDKPVKVTEHKDIEDKEQTVAIKEVPEEPAKPEPPETPATPSHKPTDSPKTGDNTNVAGFALILGLSAAGLAFAAYKKRHTMKHGTDK